MVAIYNEVDPDAARWLRNLIADGLVPAGTVEQRSIVDLAPDDVGGPGQRHFFAGIAGWGLACRLAGIPDNFDIWTGSCPCQPLSVAGRQRGHADERHLWPAFFRLIAECRPAVVVGEQVAGAAGREWLAGVRADLESAGYACGAADLPAAGVAAPHRRERLFWCGVSLEHATRLRSFPGLRDSGAGGRSFEPGRLDEGELRCDADDGTGGLRRMGHPDRAGLAQRRGERGDARAEREAAERADGGGGMEHAAGKRRGEGWPEPVLRRGRDAAAGADAHGHWSDAIWLQCHDGKARRAQPGVPLLVDGISGGVVVERPGAEARTVSRVAAWRGFGNAIVPLVAAAFLRAVMDIANA